MKKNIIFLTIIINLTTGFNLLAQDGSVPVEQAPAEENPGLPEFKNLADMQVGYYGTTQNCEPFNIYAFKYKRTWMFIAKQEANYTFLIVRPPRSEEKGVLPGSNFLYEGLSLANENAYTKLVKRRKIVKDIEVYGYYKFYRPGKKAIKGLLLLEYPDENLGLPWPFKWLSGKAEEMAESVEGVLPEVTMPEITLPEVTVPEISVPEITIPE